MRIIGVLALAFALCLAVPVAAQHARGRGGHGGHGGHGGYHPRGGSSYGQQHRYAPQYRSPYRYGNRYGYRYRAPRYYGNRFGYGYGLWGLRYGYGVWDECTAVVYDAYGWPHSVPGLWSPYAEVCMPY